jgi:hypothetical protein
LESSHRSLHNFEIRIIKAFEDRIVKTVPGRILKHGKMEKITVTLLDITLPDLKHSAMLKAYRDEHNHSRHYFSEKGQVRAWTPANKLNEYLSSLAGTLNFTRDQVRQYMKYGFRKIRATVSKKRTIRHGNRDYDVTTGAQLFSRHKSTPVKISRCKEKLFIFEPGEDGILLGEALARQPFEQPPQPQAPQMQPDELDMMILFLESRHMIVERPVLIEVYHQGISLERAKQIFHHNQARYAAYTQKIRQPEDRKKKALFNAFILDCQKAITAKRVVTYASHGDLS